MHTFHKLLDSALEWIALMLVVASSAMKSRAALQLENVALRHQIRVLQRSAKKRLSLNNSDRLFWVGLSRVWPEWRSALKILKPETVIAWHRNAVRKFWTWKVRRGKPGRPAISAEIRALIRRMSRENPSWGAPRYLLCDRDRIFGHEFVEQVKAMAIEQVLSAPRSPWKRHILSA